MHRMKLKFEMKLKKKKIPPKIRDLFQTKLKRTPNPERLADNGTLDTYLHRIRLEILDESKYKQNKSDNLTRKERLALRELIHNHNLIINNADKGSTIVVEDRDEYIQNAMEHLNNPDVYKPLNDDISNDLKQNIIRKLEHLDYTS